jgi:hypothetical protein
MNHKISYIPQCTALHTVPSEIWDDIAPVQISHYPWAHPSKADANLSEKSLDKNITQNFAESPAESPPDITAAAKIFYTNTQFFVRFEVTEPHIRAMETQINGPVCQDSCVEFFFNPCPEISGQYINIEINPLGVMHLAVGEGRHHRNRLDNTFHRLMHIDTRIDSPHWRAEYNIPFAMLEALYGPVRFAPGYAMKGNFYKCGDKTRSPHFGCWNLIETPQPDFHRPEYFGELVLDTPKN